MISKGIGDIRSLQTINTRPGPMTEKSLLLRLFKLASQKANFKNKKEWAERQRAQAIRHLKDTQRHIDTLKRNAAAQKIGASLNLDGPEAAMASTGKKVRKVALEY
ncbi:hypothetical protein KKB40_06505 [Patescibacteria group bacterium]|nr:hypothetical protein [Patescibacteria group bacterium]